MFRPRKSVPETIPPWMMGTVPPFGIDTRDYRTTSDIDPRLKEETPPPQKEVFPEPYLATCILDPWFRLRNRLKKDVEVTQWASIVALPEPIAIEDLDLSRFNQYLQERTPEVTTLMDEEQGLREVTRVLLGAEIVNEQVWPVVSLQTNSGLTISIHVDPEFNHEVWRIQQSDEKSGESIRYEGEGDKLAQRIISCYDETMSDQLKTAQRPFFEYQSETGRAILDLFNSSDERYENEEGAQVAELNGISLQELNRLLQEDELTRTNVINILQADGVSREIQRVVVIKDRFGQPPDYYYDVVEIQLNTTQAYEYSPDFLSFRIRVEGFHENREEEIGIHCLGDYTSESGVKRREFRDENLNLQLAQKVIGYLQKAKKRS